MTVHPSQIARRERGTAGSVLAAFLKLGVTSFGGPVAHIGYFRAEFVERRKWLDEASYVDLVALCQFLPGPASSQVGISIGILRAGLPGGLCAWLGFTSPSAIAMILFAYGVTGLGDLGQTGWLHGLKIVAVAVVAQAVWGMARTLCPDRERATLAVGAAVVALFLPYTIGQIGVIAAGGIIGWLVHRFRSSHHIAAPPHANFGIKWCTSKFMILVRFLDLKFLHRGCRTTDRNFKSTAPVLPTAVGNTAAPLAVPIDRTLALGSLALFAVLLVGLPLLASITADQTIRLIDGFYRAGSLVFGGGHVVLPLLQQEVVPKGWVDNDAFLAGYGAAQAVPGPLFTFAAYLGAVMKPWPNGWLGGLVCLIAIFAPSFLLVVGTLPLWNDLRQRTAIQAALKGVNAAVVGLLIAALYTPVWTSAIKAPADFAIGIAAFLLLMFWKVPPWLVVVLGAMAAAATAYVIR